jgi:hypothetical protein
MRRGGGHVIVVVNVVNVLIQEGRQRWRSADRLHPNGGGLVDRQRVPTGQRRDERAGEAEWQQDGGEGGRRRSIAIAVGEIGIDRLPGQQCAVLDKALTLRRRLQFGRGNNDGGGGAMTTDGDDDCRDADNVFRGPGRTTALTTSMGGRGLCLRLQFAQALFLLRLNDDNGRAAGGRLMGTETYTQQSTYCQ